MQDTHINQSGNVPSQVIHYTYVFCLIRKIIFGDSYKGLLDIHLLNMSKHSWGRNSGAVCPPPCKFDQLVKKLVMFLVCGYVLV
jgi:hypothetical protein